MTQSSFPTVSQVAKDLTDGFFGGVMTGYGIAPLITCKNIVQQKKAQEQRMRQALEKGLPLLQEKPIVFPKNPLAYWKGAMGFSIVLGPMTAATNAIKEAFDVVLSHQGRRLLTKREELATSFTAGAIMGIPLNVAEVILINQQKERKNYFPTAVHLRHTYGWEAFFTASKFTVVREGVSAATFFAAAPIAQEYFAKKTSNETAARFLGAGVTGAIAVILTQGIDGEKTDLQANLNLKRLPLSLFKAMVRPGALAGGGWRWGMFTVAGVAIPWCKEKGGEFVAQIKDRLQHT